MVDAEADQVAQVALADRGAPGRAPGHAERPQAVREAGDHLPGRVLAAAHRHQAVVAAAGAAAGPLRQARPVGRPRLPVDGGPRRVRPAGRADAVGVERQVRPGVRQDAAITPPHGPSQGRHRRSRKITAPGAEDSRVIAIVNIGLSNLGSVRQALSRVGARSITARSAGELDEASAVVLPGVGAFGDGMAALRAQGLVEPLRRHAASGTPAARHLPRHAAPRRRERGARPPRRARHRARPRRAPVAGRPGAAGAQHRLVRRAADASYYFATATTWCPPTRPTRGDVRLRRSGRWPRCAAAPSSASSSIRRRARTRAWSCSRPSRPGRSPRERGPPAADPGAAAQARPARAQPVVPDPPGDRQPDRARSSATRTGTSTSSSCSTSATTTATTCAATTSSSATAGTTALDVLRAVAPRLRHAAHLRRAHPHARGHRALRLEAGADKCVINTAALDDPGARRARPPGASARSASW